MTAGPSGVAGAAAMTGDRGTININGGTLNRSPMAAAARLTAALALAVATLSPDPATATGGQEHEATPPDVTLWRLPDGGRLPRAVAADDGTVHVVYVDGPTSPADLRYVQRTPDASAWSAPQRVNDRPRSVLGVGPIDGGELALGPDGRRHVAWLGDDPPVLRYTRSRPDGAGFEPPRHLVAPGAEAATGLEAAPAIVVHDRHVTILWHAGHGDDAARRVFALTSSDGGETFGTPRAVNRRGRGACACCGVAAARTADGTVTVAYRGAGDNRHRGQRLLRVGPEGHPVTDRRIEAWTLAACPVTTTDLAVDRDGPTLAWETAGQVRAARLGADEVLTPPGDARFRRKHPSVAIDRHGTTLLVWGDGPGFSFGGALHWQRFDDAGRPWGPPGGGPTVIIPGSLAAAVALDDRFVIVY